MVNCGDRHPGGSADVDHLQVAASDQLVGLRPADAQHRRSLGDRQQEPVTLPNRRRIAHRTYHVHRGTRSATR
jgi:hypothetical protein